MKVVRLAEAKKDLSHHLEYVKRGGTIRLVDHGRPVADLVPVPDDDAALLRRLEKRGIVRRGKGGPVPDDLLHPGPRGAGVLDALTEERRGSR